MLQQHHIPNSGCAIPAGTQSNRVLCAFQPVGEWQPDMGIGRSLPLWHPPWFSCLQSIGRALLPVSCQADLLRSHQTEQLEGRRI